MSDAFNLKNEVAVKIGASAGALWLLNAVEQADLADMQALIAEPDTEMLKAIAFVALGLVNALTPETRADLRRYYEGHGGSGR